MFYVQLYNKSSNNPFSSNLPGDGPFIGPLSGVYWNSGFLMLEYADKKFELQMNSDLSSFDYAGERYNAYRIVSSFQLYEMGIFFCGQLAAIHDIDMFEKLLTKL